MYLNIFSANAAGLKYKIQSLKSEIAATNAAIFTVQESHFEKEKKTSATENMKKLTFWLHFEGA